MVWILSEEAIQVAAFSCYLALLDFLEPESITEAVRFPTLKGQLICLSTTFSIWMLRLTSGAMTS